MDASTVALLSVLAVYSSLVLASLGVVIWRRGQQPLKFRGPMLLLICGLVGYLQFVCLAYYHVARTMGFDHVFSSNDFCDLYPWLEWLTYPCLIMSYLLRYFRLNYVFHAVELRVVRAPNVDLQASEPLQGMYEMQQNRRLPRILKEWTLIKCLLVIEALLLIIKSSLNVIDPTNVHDERLRCMGSFPIVWILGSITLIVLCAVFLCTHRHVRWDDYGMYQELAVICFALSVVTLTRFLALIVKLGYIPVGFYPGKDDSNDRNYLETDVAFRLALNISLFLISVVYPIIQSFRQQRCTMWSTSDALMSLESVLADILCIQYFRNFLQEKGCDNLILCWVEIALFKDLDPDDLDTIHRHAIRLTEKYVLRQSEFELQMSENVRTKLCDELRHANQITVHSLDEVENEIFTLMKPLFILFLSSENCQLCLNDLEREEALKRLLELCHMI